MVNSYVGRDFMTALENRDHSRFLREALRYVVVFAASTVAAVLASYTQELLGLLWRNWLTRRLVGIYLTDRSYVRLQAPGGLPNPDQRISEDIRTFVTMTLSVSLMLLNGSITVVAFSGVLWSISRTLFLVGIVYAAIGSVVTDPARPPAGAASTTGRPTARPTFAPSSSTYARTPSRSRCSTASRG